MQGRQSHRLPSTQNFQNLNSRGARRVLIFLDDEGEAAEDVTEDAATEDAFDVLSVAEVFLERLPPACGFLRFRDAIAFEPHALNSHCAIALVERLNQTLKK